jgi:hypothetical protein
MNYLAEAIHFARLTYKNIYLNTVLHILTTKSNSKNGSICMYYTIIKISNSIKLFTYMNITVSSMICRQLNCGSSPPASTRLVMMGWDWHLITAASIGPTVHPRVIAMWTMVWWYQLGQPPVLSGDPVCRDISGVSRRMDEGNENLVYLFPWDFKRSLTCHKILRHGTYGFTSHLKEGVLQIFITLKNPSGPSSNPRPLGPVASILTTTPWRWPHLH